MLKVKSCRLRWFNQLDPTVNKKAFTDEEEEKLLAAHEQFGNKWTKIAALFNGRTDNAVKNQWHILMRRKLKKQSNAKTRKRRTPKELTAANDITEAEKNTDFDTRLNQKIAYNFFPGLCFLKTKFHKRVSILSFHVFLLFFYCVVLKVVKVMKVQRSRTTSGRYQMRKLLTSKKGIVLHACQCNSQVIIIPSLPSLQIPSHRMSSSLNHHHHHFHHPHYHQQKQKKQWPQHPQDL